MKLKLIAPTLVAALTALLLFALPAHGTAGQPGAETASSSAKSKAGGKQRAGGGKQRQGRKRGAGKRRAAAGPQLRQCGRVRQRKAKRACLAQNTLRRVVFNQVKNSRFVGERGDGQGVDWIFCANGRVRTETTSNTYGTGITELKSWRISNAKGNPRNYWGIVEAKVDGGTFAVAVGRTRAQWKVGVDDSAFGRLDVLYPGNVKRSSAARECVELKRAG